MVKISIPSQPDQLSDNRIYPLSTFRICVMTSVNIQSVSIPYSTSFLPLGRERGSLGELPDPEGIRRQPPALHRLHLLQGLSADGRLGLLGRQTAAHPGQGHQEREGLHEQHDRRERRPR